MRVGSRMGKVVVKTVDLVITAVGAALYYLAGCITAGFLSIPAVSWLYLPSAIAAPWGIWFGVWGVLAAYIGGVLIQPLYGISYFPWGIMLGFAEIWDALIPMILFKTLKLDVSMRSWKSWAALLISSVISGGIGGFIGFSIYVLMGFYTWKSVFTWAALGAWWASVIIDMVPIGGIILYTVSPYVTKSSLYIKGFIRTKSTTEG